MGQHRRNYTDEYKAAAVTVTVTVVDATLHTPLVQQQCALLVRAYLALFGLLLLKHRIQLLQQPSLP
tara:strand:- start:248 stop:448 length:201 start_codon:yes stop_codon:yes gene_type:complete